MREGTPTLPKPDLAKTYANGFPRKRYDKRLKSQVVRDLRSGVPVKEVSEKYAINHKTVEQWAWIYRPGKRAKKGGKQKGKVMPLVRLRDKPSQSQELAPKKVSAIASAMSQSKTLIAGFVIASPKSPGGLLDDAKSLLDRLVKEASNGSEP